jgi:predicted kinase
MRLLLLLQGAPGSGKSTFIEQHGLGPWTVSTDSLRLLYRGPEMHEAGHSTIPSSEDAKVWRTLFAMVESRLKMGDLTVVDATHTRRREIEAYRALAARYRYETFVVSWRDLPLETSLAYNAQRAPLRRVPDPVVREMHARLGRIEYPEWVRVIRPQELAAVLEDRVVDGLPYRRAHVIGDLQGWATPLQSFLEGGIAEDELYVFVGDLLDGGLENGAVLKLMLDLASRPNVLICEGDHERYLRAWHDGLPAASHGFESHTRPQLEAAGIAREAVGPLLARLVDCVLLSWRGKRVLITHGGLPAMPEPGRLLFVPAAQMIKGVGPLGLDVDSHFSRSAPEDALQIHGHRNESKLKVEAAPRSYNLAGQGEQGGALRVVTLEDDGRVVARELPNLSFEAASQLREMP